MRIDIPRAPGLGLMLDENHYERYNKRFGSDGIHESLTWENEENEIENFKENFIFSEMIQGEKEHSMFNWLKCLPMHGFVQRHFENSEPLPRSVLLFFSNEYLATRANKNVNMDSVVKMNRFHIKQNVLNLKSTLVKITLMFINISLLI